MTRLALPLAAALALSLARPASAEPPAPDAKTREQARTIFLEAVRARNRGELEASCSLLSTAWELAPHFQIAGELGRCALRDGRFREAAERFDYALREPDETLHGEPRERLLGQLAQARAHVGRLRIEVDEPGAEVVVGGVRVGRAPLDGLVYVEAGAVRVEARLDGYATAVREARVGSGEEVVLALHLDEEATKPVPALAGASEGRGLVPLVVGGAAAAGLLVGATVLTLSANGGSDDAAALRDDLVKGGGGRYPCAGSPVGATAQGCTDLRAKLGDQDGLSDAAAWMFVGAGVAAAGGAVWYLVAPASVRGDEAALRPQAFLAPGVAAIVARGRF